MQEKLNKTVHWWREGRQAMEPKAGVCSEIHLQYTVETFH